MAKWSNLDVFRGANLDIYDKQVIPLAFTLDEAKAEYARLAKVANRRLAAIRRDPYFGSSKAGKHAEFRASISNYGDIQQAAKALTNVAMFLQKKTSSLTGLREEEKRQLETLRNKRVGYEFLNENNIREFREFWEEVRHHYTNKDFDSPRVVQLYREAKKKRIDPVDLAADFDYWKQHIDDIDVMKRSTRRMTSEEAKERLEKALKENEKKGSQK